MNGTYDDVVEGFALPFKPASPVSFSLAGVLSLD
jgi:hypothetical protein